VFLARVHQRTSAFSSRQFESIHPLRLKAAIADIVDKALDLLQFRPEHFGVAKIDVPWSDFGWTSNSLERVRLPIICLRAHLGEPFESWAL
jgi:hypothetical protein